MRRRMLLTCLFASMLAVVLALGTSTSWAQEHPGTPADAGHAEAADAGHAEGAAHGGQGGGHEPEAGVIPTVKQGIATLVTALVVFVLVLVILGLKVWPKIVAGLAEREQKIRDEIAAAEAARKQAKDALTQYQQSLAEAKAEAKQMLDATKAEQQELAARLKADADVELGKLRDRARQDIEVAKKAALTEIYADAANLATLVAAKILEREVSAEDTQRLVEQSLESLDAS